MHTTQSRTRKPREWTASTTTSQHVKIEPAVMASEIERLPDLEGFLKFASIPDWRRVRLTPVSYPQVVRSRQPNTATSTPMPAAAAPPAAVPAAAPPAAPSRRAKSQAPIAKRARKPKATVTHAPTAPREAAKTGRDNGPAEPAATAARAKSDGAIENRGGGAELRD
jgi:hypothetical protein